MIDAGALQSEARDVAARRLAKKHGLLDSVSPHERRAIEEAAFAVAHGVAECLLAEAERSSLVAAALDACYPLEGAASGVTASSGTLPWRSSPFVSPPLRP
jgi:hypothetical protein